MKNALPTRSADGQIVFRFPRDRVACSDMTEGFFHLRLRMRPGTVCLELTEPGLLVGRHSSADVRLSLPDISRQHCRFLFADGQWEVLDLNSLNGIYVNGERLQRSVLCDGDTLRIASLTFEVELVGAGLTGAGLREESAAVIQRIANVLPMHPEVTEEFRKVG